MLLGDFIPILGTTWLSKSCNQLKHTTFFWLLLNDRLNTRGMLQRSNFFLQDYSCVMCSQHVVERRDHLFFHCQFAQTCWKKLCPNWPTLSSGIQDQIANLKHLLNLPFASDIIILIAWEIWNTRNGFIFRRIRPSLFACKKLFNEEMH